MKKDLASIGKRAHSISKKRRSKPKKRDEESESAAESHIRKVIVDRGIKRRRGDEVDTLSESVSSGVNEALNTLSKRGIIDSKTKKELADKGKQIHKSRKAIVDIKDKDKKTVKPIIREKRG